ncbi:hypothetical protein [Halorientalis sp.]|jgi:hypothetical protein|uniref:hypothetical protein n=1 Tax=Halorientalis sp. TaxID=1931229 RepID=UPI002611AC12|nr:hypothetical protein [Halorientalis sp.]
MDDPLHRRLTFVIALLGIAYLAWGSDAAVVAVAVLLLSLGTWTALAWRQWNGLLAR